MKTMVLEKFLHEVYRTLTGADIGKPLKIISIDEIPSLDYGYLEVIEELAKHLKLGEAVELTPTACKRIFRLNGVLKRMHQKGKLQEYYIKWRVIEGSRKGWFCRTKIEKGEEE